PILPTGQTNADGTAPLPRTAPQIRQVSDADLRAAVRDDVPLRYVVQPGDTLWNIAQHFMIEPWFWPEIWQDNPDVANPHRIYPGDVLILTHVKARPRIKLLPRIRESEVHKPIPTIPANALEALLNAPRLTTEEELDNAPYIVAFKDERLIASKRMVAFVGALQKDSPARFDIVHPDQALEDPDTGDQVGFASIPAGKLCIDSRDNDLGTAHITASTRAVRPGDRLLPARTRLEYGQFRLRKPEQVTGSIIAAYESEISVIGQYDIAIINRGRRDGLQRGHLLQIHTEGATVEDPLKGDTVQLPSQQIGVLMLFDLQERTGIGLVLEAERAVHELDRVTSSTP